jgi:hypothetical protein
VYRGSIIQKLDHGYKVEGGKFTNNKFQLIDAVNNSMKHINLDPGRYKKLIKEYGNMNFKLLVEKSGIVYMKTGRYQFDYGRIVLRSIGKILNFSYDEHESILSTIDGEDVFSGAYDPSLDPSDPSTAIDRMTENCNHTCIDCDEGEEKCTCEEYVYGDTSGEFSPDFDSEFDVDSTMFEIGSSWK